MKKTAFSAKDAPTAIGPYSQAIGFGSLVFLSGQIPMDPVSGVPVEGDVGVQTRRVLDNLSAVLSRAGLGFEDVVKTTVYLTDLALFDKMNAVYAEFFSEPFPARATVGVSALPKGVDVEIDAIAMQVS